MKKKVLILAMATIMAQAAFMSCGWNVGQGDKRDRNIGIATLNYLDSIPGVEYIGLADTRDLDNGKSKQSSSIMLPTQPEIKLSVMPG